MRAFISEMQSVAAWQCALKYNAVITHLGHTPFREYSHILNTEVVRGALQSESSDGLIDGALWVIWQLVCGVCPVTSGANLLFGYTARGIYTLRIRGDDRKQVNQEKEDHREIVNASIRNVSQSEQRNERHAAMRIPAVPAGYQQLIPGGAASRC